MIQKILKLGVFHQPASAWKLPKNEGRTSQSSDATAVVLAGGFVVQL
jgi:hypothetical protein